jgi:hypothetical protein
MKTSPLLRIISASIGWGLFLLSWWKVTRPRNIARGTFQLTGIQITACVLAIVIIASIWILYNLRIGRRGRRQAAAYIVPKYEKDVLGRRLILPADSLLASAAIITVRLESGTKVYEPERCDGRELEAAEMFEEVAR